MSASEKTEQEKTEQDEMWDDIKDRPIEMFGLPNQRVEQHVDRLRIPGAGVLYVKLVSGAVLGSLEAILSNEYEMEQAEKFLIIRKKTPELTEVDETTDDKGWFGKRRRQLPDGTPKGS
jgi:hypothetical protein